MCFDLNLYFSIWFLLFYFLYDWLIIVINLDVFIFCWLWGLWATIKGWDWDLLLGLKRGNGVVWGHWWGNEGGGFLGLVLRLDVCGWYFWLGFGCYRLLLYIFLCWFLLYHLFNRLLLYNFLYWLFLYHFFNWFLLYHFLYWFLLFNLLNCLLLFYLFNSFFNFFFSFYSWSFHSRFFLNFLNVFCHSFFTFHYARYFNV